jgi:hypothetical protein
MTLFRLAWSSKVQLPLLITVAFMAFDIHLQMEINIVWEPNHNNRREGPNNDHEEDRIEEQRIRRHLLLQINGAQAPLAVEEEDDDDEDESEPSSSSEDDEEEEDTSTVSSLPSDVDPAHSRIKFWRKDDDEDEGTGAGGGKGAAQHNSGNSNSNGTPDSTAQGQSQSPPSEGGQSQSSNQCNNSNSVVDFEATKDINSCGHGQKQNTPSWNTLHKFFEFQSQLRAGSSVSLSSAVAHCLLAQKTRVKDLFWERRLNLTQAIES